MKDPATSLTVALVRAGGAGVFIGLAHGGQQWLDMTDDGGKEPVVGA